MSMVYGRAINRDFQPDAQFGNAIELNKFGDVAVGDYIKDTDFAGGPETLVASAQTLLINQSKFFNFQIDSIDEAQTQPNLMDKAMQRSAYAMAKTVDAYIAGLYAGFTGAIGVVGTPKTPTVDDIYGYFTQAAQILDEANVPVYGRYAIVNAAGIKLLKDSGVFLSDTPAGDTVRFMGQFLDAGMLPMGYKGQVAGFDLFFSNQTPSSGTSTSIWTFGHQEGIAMVDSVNSIVGYTPEKRFADAIKGLYVFGAKVTQPGAGVTMYTTL
jgi:hypothetical protein